MSCILDERGYCTTMEGFYTDLDSSSIHLLDLQMDKRFSDLAQKDINITKALLEALDAIEIAQEKMDQMEKLIIGMDTTEYFDGEYFSNMGWLMISKRIDSQIIYPYSEIIKYLEMRTKKPEKVASSINQLVRQGLVSRRRIPISEVGNGIARESFETCLCLTDEGREVFTNVSFVYKSDYGIKETVRHRAEVLLFSNTKNKPTQV